MYTYSIDPESSEEAEGEDASFDTSIFSWKSSVTASTDFSAEVDLGDVAEGYVEKVVTSMSSAQMNLRFRRLPATLQSHSRVSSPLTPVLALREGNWVI